MKYMVIDADGTCGLTDGYLAKNTTT